MSRLGDAGRSLLRWFVGRVVRRVYRFRVVGDTVPTEGAALVVCNHISFIDAFLLAAAVPRTMRFVMASSYFEHPLLRPFFQATRAIPVASYRERPDLVDAAFDEISDALNDGEVVCIFPEGCITRHGAMNPFKGGVERILARNSVPVIPLAIVGQWGSRFSRADRATRRERPLRAPVHVVAGAHRHDSPSAQSLQNDITQLIAASGAISGVTSGAP